MFYGWDMTSNVSAGKVGIQNGAMKIEFHQFLTIHPFPHSTLAHAFYFEWERSLESPDLSTVVASCFVGCHYCVETYSCGYIVGLPGSIKELEVPWRRTQASVLF